jgi:site-specific recombinase XerD
MPPRQPNGTGTVDALLPIIVERDLPSPEIPDRAAHEAATHFAGMAKAQHTVRVYRADFRAFSAWCAERGLCALPTTSQAVAWHIWAIAAAGLSASSVNRRIAGIAYAHMLARQPNPTASEEVRIVLAGIRRTIGTAPKRKAAATADRVRAMLEACDISTLIGLRDRALLALRFAGAFRRSELIALRVEDLTEVPDGYHVRITRSKTDQTGKGQEIVIPRGLKIRPVQALQAWLQAAGITGGLLFRAIPRGGHVRSWGLRRADVASIVKRYALAAGLDPTEFPGHSLRAGFATSAAETGASILKIMETTRHKSVDVLAAYVRRVDLFRDHAGAAFL